MPEPTTVNAGCCPWCDSSVVAASANGKYRMIHPPEACCLPRALWTLSWMRQYRDSTAEQDAADIRARVCTLLVRQDDPTAVLLEAQKLAAEFDGHGNLGRVVAELAHQPHGGR